MVGSVPEHIKSLEKEGGIFVDGKFFETAYSLQTQSAQSAEVGRFYIPPDHFYFLGEYRTRLK